MKYLIKYLESQLLYSQIYMSMTQSLSYSQRHIQLCRPYLRCSWIVCTFFLRFCHLEFDKETIYATDTMDIFKNCAIRINLENFDKHICCENFVAINTVGLCLQIGKDHSRDFYIQGWYVHNGYYKARLRHARIVLSSENLV